MKKICIVTGSRAEWGLFYPLAREIRKEKKYFNLKIIATGAHLSADYGLTYKEIEEDGFKIDGKVKIDLAKDTPGAIARSAGLAEIGLVNNLESIRPDMVILLGDRFETFSAASACLFLKIPVGHISGGELTEASMDDSIRHAITKMSHLHFASIEPYRKRIIQMGEDPSRVFCVGALAIDNIRKTKLLKKQEFEEKIKFKLGRKNILITFNPPTLEKKTDSEKQFSNLLHVLAQMDDLKVIFTKPNPDIFSKSIALMIDEYVTKNRKQAIAYNSMGRVLYLSALQFMTAVAGNSSSGIIEVPSFGIPTVNIGDRQKGRIRARSVIDCDTDRASILCGLEKAFSGDFQMTCRKVSNPYDRGNTSKKIADILKDIKIDKNFFKKKFYDL